MPASVIAGQSPAEAAPARLAVRPRERFRPGISLLGKGIMLALIFIVVPIILYDQFRAADMQKRQLVMASVRDQGRIIALALTPLLTGDGEPNLPAIGRELARYKNDLATIKLLFRPAAADQVFFYVGTSEPMANDTLNAERDQLREQGVLDRLEESCSIVSPSQIRYRAPDGHDEYVISLYPVKGPSGCWAVVTSMSARALLGVALDVPYYETPEVRLAGVIYLLMASLVLTTLWSIWRGLVQFGERARAIRGRISPLPEFVARNDVPELAGVAAEFDRMVETLQNAAQNHRRAAEDNAHAFKTPVAIIRQSIEPVLRAIPDGNARAVRAVGLIEQSLDKLDGLVISARRLDTAAADLLDTPRMDIDLSALVERVVEAHAELFKQRGLVNAAGPIDAGIVVRGSEEMIETMIENVLENAVSFSPPGGRIATMLSVEEDHAELVIEDDGPGVPDANLARIFDRYYSSRPANSGTDVEEVHFGVGLSIVRRNTEALGGRVIVENKMPCGLRLRILLPLKLSGAREAPNRPAGRSGPGK